jgi:hypothetical protein
MTASFWFAQDAWTRLRAPLCIGVLLLQTHHQIASALACLPPGLSMYDEEAARLLVVRCSHGPKYCQLMSMTMHPEKGLQQRRLHPTVAQVWIKLWSLHPNILSGA